MSSRRDPNLWFSALSVRVETVTIRHTKPCVVCGVVPSGKRLKVQAGTGRGGCTFIFCRNHGRIFALRRVEEAERVAASLICDDVVPIREDVSVGDPSWRPPKKPKIEPRRDAV